MRRFFKSLWFRCIATLLIIAVISGGLLAILNDVLYVSPDERTARAIKSIYGENKQYETILDTDTNANDTCIEFDDGKISKIYIVGDKNSEEYDYLFQSTGYNGYKNGTVTIWVQITIKSNSYLIKKVILANSEKQTLMSKLDANYYNNFTNNYTGETNNIVTGATKSSTACSNAVNTVIGYINGGI